VVDIAMIFSHRARDTRVTAGHNARAQPARARGFSRANALRTRECVTRATARVAGILRRSERARSFV
jgi:hypothetical protein